MTLASSFNHSLTVARSDRWLVYQRLLELGISCQCPQEGGLQVSVSSPAIAAQVWSVVLQTTAPRSHLVSWLEQCWQGQ